MSQILYLTPLTIINVPFAGGQAYKTIGTIHRDSPEINSLIPEHAVMVMGDSQWERKLQTRKQYSLLNF